MCFVDAEWPLFSSKPFQLREVWISRPVKLAELAELAELAGQPGPVGPEQIPVIARLLAERLPAKLASG